MNLVVIKCLLNPVDSRFKDIEQPQLEQSPRRNGHFGSGGFFLLDWKRTLKAYKQEHGLCMEVAILYSGLFQID